MAHTPATSIDYYWRGGGHTGSTSGTWDDAGNWLVKVVGVTGGSPGEGPVGGSGSSGASGSAFSGDGYYFAPATRTPHGSDRVWLSYQPAQPVVGIGATLPQTNLQSGGWGGSTWNSSTSGVTTENAGACSVRIQSNYNYPVGITTGTGVSVHADEVRMKNDSNHEVVWSNGSSLGYVLSEGTHSLRIADSTVYTIELRKSENLNDTGQYGNFVGSGNTYNNAINILGYASGRFTHINGYGGSGGYIPYVNVACAYRDPIKIDVDVNKLAVAPAGIQTGHYSTVDPVKVISSASNHRRDILTLVQSAENDTNWGQFVGNKTNNPVEINCGCTITNHIFGSGLIGVGSNVFDDDEIVVVDGTITSNCKVNTIHPDNPNYAGFKVGENHGNTVEGYLVMDDKGDSEFVFSRGHYVKANFGERGAADSGIVSQSGGK